MPNFLNTGAVQDQRLPMREPARAQQMPDWNRESNTQAPWEETGATPWLPAGEMPGYQVNFQPTGSTAGNLRPMNVSRPVGLQLSSGLTPEEVESPVNEQEALRGSLKGLLARNLGHYVVATFLVGTQSPVSWEGFLHSVGNDYMVIYQPDQGRYITGDFYSLKFVEFHDTAGVRPSCPGYRRRDGQQMW